MKTQRQRISERSSRSSSLVKGGGSSEFIPVGLIIEILSRLPVKFIARCRCVSKLWTSIIRSPYFTELVLSISKTTRPQVLFACVKYAKVFFFSSPQPRNPDEKSSPITANCYMNFSFNNGDGYSENYQLVHGLICLKQMRILKGREDMVLVICNPSTGQSLRLPKVKTWKIDVICFFGYDPIDKQFKLLCMTRRSSCGINVVSEEHQILTLGNGTLLWRMIECGIPHYPISGGICINGVLYYQVRVRGFERKFMIVCFDIRSEKFKLIEKEDKVERAMLVNYKGKLATLKSDYRFGLIDEKSRSIELCVLEDAEKLEWSTHTYVLPPSWTDVCSSGAMYITGVTRTGEIARLHTNHPTLFTLFSIISSETLSEKLKSKEKMRLNIMKFTPL